MAEGILRLALYTATAAAVIGLLLYWRPLLRRAVRVARRLHLLREPPPAPHDPPIERLARDLRRLRAQTLHHRPGESRVRRVAAQAAYDEALVEACRELDLPDTLSGLPPGTDREAERLRIEWLLAERGLDIG
jgi:hypothetical protein